MASKYPAALPIWMGNRYEYRATLVSDSDMPATSAGEMLTAMGREGFRYVGAVSLGDGLALLIGERLAQPEVPDLRARNRGISEEGLHDD